MAAALTRPAWPCCGRRRWPASRPPAPWRHGRLLRGTRDGGAPPADERGALRLREALVVTLLLAGVALLVSRPSGASVAPACSQAWG